MDCHPIPFRNPRLPPPPKKRGEIFHIGQQIVNCHPTSPASASGDVEMARKTLLHFSIMRKIYLKWMPLISYIYHKQNNFFNIRSRKKKVCGRRDLTPSGWEAGPLIKSPPLLTLDSAGPVGTDPFGMSQRPCNLCVVYVFVQSKGQQSELKHMGFWPDHWLVWAQGLNHL